MPRLLHTLLRFITDIDEAYHCDCEEKCGDTRFEDGDGEGGCGAGEGDEGMSIFYIDIGNEEGERIGMEEKIWVGEDEYGETELC